MNVRTVSYTVDHKGCIFTAVFTPEKYKGRTLWSVSVWCNNRGINSGEDWGPSPRRKPSMLAAQVFVNEYIKVKGM